MSTATCGSCVDAKIPDIAALIRATLAPLKRNASQIARLPGAVRGESLFSLRIKLAGARVPLNGSIELRRVEGLEPRTKPRELARAELFDGFLDVFGGGHDRQIAFGRGAEKGEGRNGKRSSHQRRLRPGQHWALRYFFKDFMKATRRITSLGTRRPIARLE